uniref:Uncharacterized protein n=1 Tax=Cairina moschata TaxID=8855 RepID=A0A8C3GDN6_CAIMO
EYILKEIMYIMPYSYSTVSTDYKGISLHKCVEVLKSNLTRNSVNVNYWSLSAFAFTLTNEII